MERSFRWEEIFRQEGVSSGDPGSGDLDPDEWSMLVLNSHLPSDEQHRVMKYLSRGGALLAPAEFARFLLPGDPETRTVSFLLGDRIPWDIIGLVDLGRPCLIPSGANSLPDEEGRSTAFIGGINGGSVVVLPFDPAVLLFDDRSQVRKFYSARERLPFEKVSSISKDEIRHLISRSLQYLHHTRGLPYAHLWYYPEANENLLAFRIDTDGAPREDIEAMHEVAERHGVPLTWYVDVASHEYLLPLFRTMKSDEVSLHCYEHRSFPSREATRDNIRKGRALMENSGVHPKGFAAPYGDWNNEIGHVILDEKFLYSSEFSYACDTLPFRPVLDNEESGVLQVPVHPICIGSLLRTGYTRDQMTSYFDETLARKLARNEPLFFYHHPAHRCWEVVESLFRAVSDRGIGRTTLQEYARWWKSRETVDPEITVIGEQVFVRKAIDRSIRVRIILPDGTARIVSGDEQTIPVSADGWKAVPRIAPPVDLRRIRETDLRTSVARWYNIFLRRAR